MADAKTTYESLIAEVKQIGLLGSGASVLGWDVQTYMPKGGAKHRGDQLALLAGMVHERGTAKQIGDWLGEVEGSDVVSDPISIEAVNVREIRRGYETRRNRVRTKLPDVPLCGGAPPSEPTQAQTLAASRPPEKVCGRYRKYRPPAAHRVL